MNIFTEILDPYGIKMTDFGDYWKHIKISHFPISISAKEVVFSSVSQQDHAKSAQQTGTEFGGKMHCGSGKNSTILFPTSSNIMQWGVSWHFHEFLWE